VARGEERGSPDALNGMGTNPPSSWSIVFTPEAEAWYKALRPRDTHRVNRVVDSLADGGPGLGRPHVDHVKGARHPNLKELRSRGTCLRMLFAFDRNRTAIVLVGGDKRAQGKSWYLRATRDADRLFDKHLHGQGKVVRWEDIREPGRGSEPRSR
jgi:hypothetical protein